MTCRRKRLYRLRWSLPAKPTSKLSCRFGSKRCASLERIGRFDPSRARERFRESFASQHTRHIVVGGQRVGFVAVKPLDDLLLLDHLYLLPAAQGRGVGSAVLAVVFAEAAQAGKALRVGALRGSDSNRFYVRHGFQLVEESTWDLHYVRPARPS